MVYFIHKYVNDDKLARTFSMFALASLKGMPTSVKRYTYDTIVLTRDGMSVSDMPCRMRKPLMQRFSILIAPNGIIKNQKIKRMM
ncbi:hypothetical protein EP47_11785 [Legionella norrlandica]|uniref:Uncharacterized protein n=1 Tax=Legionella norrlandica TaxID=1498499 RepID=A0A0A2SYF9_9GAMM|nr:hypothetical protein EP47_11785 [Legionella norrlandica]